MRLRRASLIIFRELCTCPVLPLCNDRQRHTHAAISPSGVGDVLTGRPFHAGSLRAGDGRVEDLATRCRNVGFCQCWSLVRHWASAHHQSPDQHYAHPQSWVPGFSFCQHVVRPRRRGTEDGPKRDSADSMRCLSIEPFFRSFWTMTRSGCRR